MVLKHLIYRSIPGHKRDVSDKHNSSFIQWVASVADTQILARGEGGGKYRPLGAGTVELPAAAGSCLSAAGRQSIYFDLCDSQAIIRTDPVSWLNTQSLAGIARIDAHPQQVDPRRSVRIHRQRLLVVDDGAHGPVERGEFGPQIAGTTVPLAIKGGKIGPDQVQVDGPILRQRLQGAPIKIDRYPVPWPDFEIVDLIAP